MKILFFLLISFSVHAQTPGADKVLSWKFGNNTDFGQSSEFFPANVIGNPDTAASVTVPSANPEHVVSLGLGGWIILEFTDNLIINGQGPDFVVFENVFWPGGDSTKSWKEPGIVSVSEDGIQFFTFPFDSVTWSGCAGTVATTGSENPQNWPACGGNAFDLSIVGLSSARFIRIDDRSYWNPFGSGFDLDAVVAIHSQPVSVADLENQKPAGITISAWPNPFNPETTLNWSHPVAGITTFSLISLTGETILSWSEFISSSGNQQRKLNLNKQASGIYIIRIQSGNQTGFFKLVLLK
ncbi:MAG: T9SS type A sorting domain-containing protein [Bacteroidetes bacterium]|nr:T9SS type A sorting domain-containing protein [Bacteroidota bacterium]